MKISFTLTDFVRAVMVTTVAAVLVPGAVLAGEAVKAQTASAIRAIACGYGYEAAASPSVGYGYGYGYGYRPNSPEYPRNPSCIGYGYGYGYGDEVYGYGYSAPTKPLAPSQLAARLVDTSIPSNGRVCRVDLTWSDRSTNESGFTIERQRPGSASWSTLATTTANTAAYSDNLLYAVQGQYAYRVRATNAVGSSNPSNTVWVMNTCSMGATSPTIPLAPSNLSGSVTTGIRPIVTLTWQDRAVNEIGFRVERSMNGGLSWSPVGFVGANTTTYRDTTVQTLRTYQYRVKAIGTRGDSAYTAPYTVTIRFWTISNPWSFIWTNPGFTITF